MNDLINKWVYDMFNRDTLLSLKTTSAKIRYLASFNLSRSEISNILNIRYQHVRNVLLQSPKKVEVVVDKMTSDDILKTE